MDHCHSYLGLAFLALEGLFHKIDILCDKKPQKLNQYFLCVQMVFKVL
jgi:hypothetical protein